MLFNSFSFLWFYPFALLLYWTAARTQRVQNVVLLALSYVFYAWWDVRFLLLIVLVTAVGYASALAIGRPNASERVRTAACWSGVGACLLMLGVFKYFDFFAAQLNALLHALHLAPSLPLLHLLLPVGISFYTFQVVGYVVDVRRGKVPPCRDAVAFATFVSFFPQLVAGPIERASDLLPQMQRRRSVRYADLADAFRLMLWGFVKKMLLADRCAPLVSAAFANPDATSADLWAAAVLFAFQIYGDFSGYSDIAIGVARTFGIRLSQNFRLPYFSRSVPEFWRRWHITLMTWFKDYVYIPLGGSRCSRLKRLRNVTLVFLISGLWHGANWTFVVWGLFQLIGFFPPTLRGGKSQHDDDALNVRRLPSVRQLLQMAVTFVFVCTGWVFFRSADMASALHRIAVMYTTNPLHKPFCGLGAFLPVVFVVMVEWLMRTHRHALDIRGTGLLRYRAVRWAVYYALIFATILWGGQQSAFIYFQF